MTTRKPEAPFATLPPEAWQRVVNAESKPEIEYPESDGRPMADNTRQFYKIVTIQGGMDALVRDRADVFVAGDLLWYPVEGRPDLCTAPDVMVVFGRPKGHRGSYLQWHEENIPPQVVFEILSPGNSATEMARKRRFYERHGVEEYYMYDPDANWFEGWVRTNDRLVAIPDDDLAGWVSPRLGIRFELEEGDLVIYRPDGERFLTYVELEVQREQERQRAEQAQQRAEQEHQRAERLAAQLRTLGIEPEE
jgi:Uma2 family endonuclease